MKSIMLPMTAGYEERRVQIQRYFDRTAAQAWARLTSDAPVGRIRASVRAGRDRMRRTLLSWLPDDLHGARLLDAGCGTGAFAVEAANRGADVVAIDLSPTLVALARARQPALAGSGTIDFRAGDMLDPGLGRFDYVVAMDSLIHYQPADAIAAIAVLSQRTATALVFTHVPSNPFLIAMHSVGRLFPQGNRSPSIVPVDAHSLHRRLDRDAGMQSWSRGRSRRIASGFYTSQALELVRA